MDDKELQEFKERRRRRADGDRSFDLEGETLTYKPAVEVGVGLRLRKMWVDLVEQNERESTNGGTDDSGRVVTDEDVLENVDSAIRYCLMPSCHEAWERLRSPDAEYPLTFEDLFWLIDYLTGKIAGIPTVAPADSSAGRRETANTSEENSPSPVTSLTASG